MQLAKGTCKKAIGKNIATAMRLGKPKKQANAMSKTGKTKRKRS